MVDNAVSAQSLVLQEGLRLLRAPTTQRDALVRKTMILPLLKRQEVRSIQSYREGNTEPLILPKELITDAPHEIPTLHKFNLFRVDVPFTL